jgi:Ribbon-helix-helix domain
MPASKRTRLTISWTKETDLDLRTYLGDQGMKKGDLSKFIEDAVRWHLFNQTVTTIKARNATSDPRSLMQMIDATVRDVRRERARYREALSTLD